MIWSAALGCVWILLVSTVPLIPFPQHKPYAIAMLVLFPVLLVLIALDFGVLWTALLFAGAVSIYRYSAGLLLWLAMARPRGKS